MWYERLHGNRDIFRTLDKISFSAAALLGDSERRLEECRNAVRCLELTSCEGPDFSVLSGRVENDFVREGGNWVKWACVRACDARDLMAAVTTRNGVHAVLGAVIWRLPSCAPPCFLLRYV
jgi:hypothetical protein